MKTKNVTSSSVNLGPEVAARYSIQEKLGQGCFASVYRVLRVSDNAQFAMKVVSKSNLDADTHILLQNELDALRLVSEYPGVVTLHDTITTPSHMCFIMEYIRGGPLLDKVIAQGSFSENDARLLFRAILRTLAYMAKVGVVHRDIKPENLLVDLNSLQWPVKLTDFGLSGILSPDTALSDRCGTPYFVAPEVLTGADYDSAVDCYSCGVVLYTVLSGYPPFFQKEPADLIAAIVGGKLEFPEPEWNFVSPAAKDVISRMLTVNPRHRITPADALQHPWFIAAQSTTALSNKRLGDFSAGRKMRAAALTVRTAFSMLRMMPAAGATVGGARVAKQFAEVERARAIIAKVEFEGASAEAEMRRKKQRIGRRPKSLILPTAVLTLPPCEDISPRSPLVHAVKSAEDENEDSAMKADVERARAVVEELRQSQTRVFSESGAPLLARLNFSALEWDDA